MSRIGKKPILIPENVEVKIEGQKVLVKGPKGELSGEIRPEIKVEMKDGKVLVSPQVAIRSSAKKNKQTKALWGLTRALLSNMIKGVKEGYEKTLEIQGIGFKANVEPAQIASKLEAGKGEELLLYVGFINPVKIKISKDIKVTVEKNIITISGINKELVGQFAANIRKVKPPEPYKGKGIRYVGEQIRRKVGKKVVTAG